MKYQPYNNLVERLSRRQLLNAAAILGTAAVAAPIFSRRTLAAPIFIVEQKLVGPSLGQDNIDRGVFALEVGLGVVFVFMAFYYRGFGFLF